MKNIKSNKQGFTLIELLIVIAIIGVLAGLLVPTLGGISRNAERVKSVNNVKEIGKSLLAFAVDNDSFFPTQTSDGDDFTSSNEAWETLLEQNPKMGKKIFWLKTKTTQTPPDETTGTIDSDETIYGYAPGMELGDFTFSPLVFEGFINDGEVTDDHPWLDKKKIVIGYVDGHVETNDLTEGAAGATVISEDKKVENIFEERVASDDGGFSGGYLDTELSNLVYPVFGS